MRTRLQPADRKKQILAAAMQIAAKAGLSHVTREAVAHAAGVSTGLVPFYFDDMAGLRKAVVKEAIRAQNVKIVGEALMLGDRQARRAPIELRQKAVASLCGTV